MTSTTSGMFWYRSNTERPTSSPGAKPSRSSSFPSDSVMRPVSIDCPERDRQAGDERSQLFGRALKIVLRAVALGGIPKISDHPEHRWIGQAVDERRFAVAPRTVRVARSVLDQDALTVPFDGLRQRRAVHRGAIGPGRRVRTAGDRPTRRRRSGHPFD